jgi:zinc protease
MYERKIESESAEYKDLSYKEPVDNFNRAEMPQARPAKPVAVPDFYTAKTANEIPVIGITENEIPKVNILVSFKAGHRFEPIDKSGVSQLLAAMLGQSTNKTSAEEIENKLNRLGSSLNIYSGDEELNFSISSLKPNLGATLKIVEECLFDPKYDAGEFELEKKKQLDGISQMQTNASALAEIAYRKILYGPDHIMGYTASGTTETVNDLTLQDVKNYYASLQSGVASVAVSGDISQAEIMNGLTFLSKLKKGNDPATADKPAPKIEKTRIYFMDKKNAAQSEIRIGYLALPYDPLGDFYKASIMNFCFAGAFNSRTNYLLREVKGWTYGTRAGFSGSKFAGPYTMSGGFKSNTTDSTLTEIFEEFKKYTSDGITDQELEFTKKAIAQSDALKYESPVQKLGFIKRVLEYDLPKDYVAQQTSILNQISKKEVDHLAKKYLPYKNMVVVVVGDKAANFEKVKKLGYDVVEVDVNGNKLN